MITYPPAKINIGLQILSKREDGFHNLSTLFYPIALSDVLEIIPAPDKELCFSSSGIVLDCNMENNLVVKAFHLLAKDFSLSPVHIHLHKQIPTGAGLGGGSSDAASALVLLNKLFELELTNEQLCHYALQLGSDVPFFITSVPAIASGRGELLSPKSVPQLSGKYITVVKPDLHISTADAYAKVQPSHSSSQIEEMVDQPITEWRDVLFNDFEQALFPHYDQLEAVKQHLYDKGAIYAAMSGSGAAFFGIFDTNTPLKFPNSYSWTGIL